MRTLTSEQWNKKALKQIEGFIGIVDHANKRDGLNSKIIITLRDGRIYYHAEDSNAR